MASLPSQRDEWNHSNPNFNRSRGRGYYNSRGNNRGRGGNRGNNRGRGGYSNHGSGRKSSSTGNDNLQNQTKTNYYSSTAHGDMKTGLFKDSFLEDPWEELIYGKKQNPTSHTPIMETPIEKEDGISDEGEIILSDDDDDFDESRREIVIGLGEGIVEAARGLS